MTTSRTMEGRIAKHHISMGGRGNMANKDSCHSTTAVAVSDPLQELEQGTCVRRFALKGLQASFDARMEYQKHLACC